MRDGTVADINGSDSHVKKYGAGRQAVWPVTGICILWGDMVIIARLSMLAEPVRNQRKNWIKRDFGMTGGVGPPSAMAPSAIAGIDRLCYTSVTGAGIGGIDLLGVVATFTSEER